MESRGEFLDRINSFEHSLLSLGDGYFNANPSLASKVGENGELLPFYGDTVVFRLSEKDRKTVSGLIDRLYSDVPECFAQRLPEETLHMTLHDLCASPDSGALRENMVSNEAALRSAVLPVAKAVITMKTKAVFNMVNTSLVLGLYPSSEKDYINLMRLYGIPDRICPLPYPLTPHITLAYYRRNGFDTGAAKKLENTVNALNEKSFEISLSINGLYYQHFSDMKTYTDIFCLDSIKRYYVKALKAVDDLPENERQAALEKLAAQGEVYSPAQAVDIYSRGDSQQHTLSNFCRANIVLDGVKIRTLEGFMQAIKNPHTDAQRNICAYRGKRAKSKSDGPKSFDHRTVYWNGKAIDRLSGEYTELLRRLYRARFDQDEKFRIVLLGTKGKKLLHTMGGSDKLETILTAQEFTDLLTELRDCAF